MADKNKRTNQKPGKVWVATVKKDESNIINSSDVDVKISEEEENKNPRIPKKIATKDQNDLSISLLSKTKNDSIKSYSFDFLLDLAPKHRQIPARLYKYLKSLGINAFGRKKSNPQPPHKVQKKIITSHPNQTIEKKKNIERDDGKITLKDLQMLFEVTRNQSEITIGQLKNFAKQNKAKVRYDESRHLDILTPFTDNSRRSTHIPNSRSVSLSRKNSIPLSRKNSTPISRKNSASVSRKNSTPISRKNSASVSRKNSASVSRKNSTPVSLQIPIPIDISRKKSAPLPYRMDDYCQDANKLEMFRHSFSTTSDVTKISFDEMVELRECQMKIRKLQSKLAELHIRRQAKISGREEDIRKLKESFQVINSRLQEQCKTLQKENAELSSIVSVSDQENDKLQRLLSLAGEKKPRD